MTVGTLLRELAQVGLTLAQVPDFAGLTLGGIIATGSFGSSLAESASFHDQLVSVTMATGLGDILVVVEGEDLNAVKVNLGMHLNWVTAAAPSNRDPHHCFLSLSLPQDCWEL